ncbi:Luciferase [Mycena sanguinolenta]|uniref:Luciferase n=1 Tax=Mycena sanguinolenta TaxID=230812 RepID=A0A8H6Y9W0_9AGAR|nr:Luciferase [Mycena sanguinolenta]
MQISWTNLGGLSIALAAAAAFPFIRRDYHTFLEVGPSYAPQNVRGYIIVLVLALFRQEGTGLAIYDRLPEKRRWLPELPMREGPRPKTTSHIIQRQLDQHVEPEFAANALKSTVIQRVQARHTDKTHLALSKFEFHAEAIFLRPSIPIDDPKNVPSHDTVRRTKREIAHMHDYHDFTLHLALAAQDGKQVVAKGWGQRHPLAGPGVPGPPTEWTFLYAPRNEEEVKVVELIIEASIGYMTNAPAVDESSDE